MKSVLRYIENALSELSYYVHNKILEQEKLERKRLFYVVGSKNDPNTQNNKQKLSYRFREKDLTHVFTVFDGTEDVTFEGQDLSITKSKALKFLSEENERTFDELIKNALSKDGVLVTPEGVNMVINLPGVCICSKPRKDGRWQGYILENGDKYYVYGATPEEVATKIKFYIRYGIPKRKAKKENGAGDVPTTFNKFANYYFTNFRKKKVSERTYTVDLYRYERYIKPHFGEISLKKITPLACQNLIEDVSSAGKGKTASEIYSLLSVIFKMAIKHDVLTKNPLDIIYKERYESQHGSALTKSEEEILKKSLEGSDLLPIAMLSLYTGLRPNELKTAVIDGPFIIAINSKRKNKKVEYKKIPICKMLAPYLSEGLPKIPNLDRIRKHIRNVLPGHVLYDLRTTFYSRLKECDVSQHAINSFMGHSLGAVANAYTDLSDEFLLREMTKFEY